MLKSMIKIFNFNNNNIIIMENYQYYRTIIII